VRFFAALESAHDGLLEWLRIRITYVTEDKYPQSRPQHYPILPLEIRRTGST
jgi:hypothetical protein